MQIYTCNTSVHKKLNKIKALGLGVLISTHADITFAKSFLNQDIEGISLALDNGAFANYKNGQPFNEYAFLWHLNQCIFKKVQLDFIVCPDIVAGGVKSLEFSLRWADRLNWNRLALVVQDGMTIDDIPEDDRFSHIFVGGTVDWKWRTAGTWIKYAHEIGKKCHVGQCGTLSKINHCRDLGADSVDSTSFVRNDSFDIIEEHQNPKQMTLI